MVTGARRYMYMSGKDASPQHYYVVQTYITVTLYVVQQYITMTLYVVRTFIQHRDLIYRANIARNRH